MTELRVDITTGAQAADADLHAIGLPDGTELPDALAGAAGAADVRTGYRKLTLLRPDPTARLLVVGLGPRDELDAERLRVAAALAAGRARRFDASSIAWAIPPRLEALEPSVAVAAIVEGTALASYRFDRFRSPDPDDPPAASLERLTLVLEDEIPGVSEAAEAARVAAAAANRARELAHLPANVLTPTALAERAREIAGEHDSVSAEVLGRAEIAGRGMGGIAAVSAGSAQEPQLIALRYAGGGHETLGMVGKAVTFDSGGISIKPALKMEDMKMDMSGGAAVIEAVGAIAELGLELDVAAVVPATENMPSGTATRPGDVITQLNGKTVEVINTDAEGRLILADALTYCARELGAGRLVDVATLTGSVVVALGSTYAGLLSNDEEWSERVAAAGRRTGELVWRLPLHPEYRQATKGTISDLVNTPAKRKAGTSFAGAFLEQFVEGRPWAHLDIAGTAYETGREYFGSGPSGFGTRLLVELARELSGDPG